MVSLTLYTLTNIAKTLIQPTSMFVLIIVACMFYRKNKKITLMQKIVVGKSLNSPLELTISEIVIGIFGAVLASLLIIYLGITFDENSMVELIFLVSILFMLVKPRFICFSYSGAALGLLSIIFEQLSIILEDPSLDIFKIDVVQLMSLIAVLHFVEGIMIIIDGRRGAIPVFTNKKGKISGGFALKRYWILPISLLFIMKTNFASGINLNIPSWWPLLKNNFSMNMTKGVILGTFTFYGVIGYESVTFTKTKEKKTILSGIWVLGYSLALFSFSQLPVQGTIFQLLLLAFAPLGHEGMIFAQKYHEAKSDSIYVSSDEGMMVLEVAPNSQAYDMGIRSGDLLMYINNRSIKNEKDIIEVINDAPNYIRLKARKISGELKELKYDNLISKSELGAVFVPKYMPESKSVVKIQGNQFEKILEEVQKNHRNKE